MTFTRKYGRSVLMAAAAVVVALATPAAAAPAAIPSGEAAPGLQVTFAPPDAPTTAIPGRVALADFRVTNPGRASVPVKVWPAMAIPGDNGQLEFADRPDPRFGSGITLGPTHFVAKAGSTTTISVRVAVPPALAPGGYLLGFLAQPETGGHGMTVENRIGALVTLLVPGITREHLSAAFHGLGRKLPVLGYAQLATHGKATLRVTDDGPSSLFSFHEINASLGAGLGHAVLHGHTPGLDGDVRVKRQLYMPGTWKDEPVSWTAAPFGFGPTHLRAAVSFRASVSTTRSALATADVWVVSPWSLLILVGWLTLLLVTASQRAGRLDRNLRRGRAGKAVRAGRAATALVVGVLVLATASAGDRFVFAALTLAGVVVTAAVGFRPRNGLEPLVRGRRMRVVALALAAGAALLGSVAVVNVAGGHSAGQLWGVLAALGAWVVLIRGVLYRHERPRTAGGDRAPAARTA